MCNIIILNIIVIEIALLWCIFNWDEEIINFLIDLTFNIRLNWMIFIFSILWIFHAGNESYQITYTKGGKDDEMYEINFPAIWMK